MHARQVVPRAWGSFRLSNRWVALAALFTVRLTMSFQFENVAAVAPLMQRNLGVSLAEIGFLIGVYLLPGVLLAIPGGAIGRHFGDRRAVCGGLLLTIIGGIVTVVWSDWNAQLIGRLVAGAGGVMLSVVMTKMVVDWFSGRETATAMAVYLNSWPAGIALALLVLPPIGVTFGEQGAFIVSTFVVAFGLVLFLAIYRDPPIEAVTASGPTPPPQRLPMNAPILAALFTASQIWCFYNIAFAMVFSFGPTLLTERGYSIATAGSAVSIVLWLSIISVPLGGLLADRTGYGNFILVAGSLVMAALLIAAGYLGNVALTFVLMGLLCGIPVGSIMELPARLLSSEHRAMGMGIFFTVYYVGIVVGAVLAGSIAGWAGTARATFEFGAGLILLCPLLLLAFRRLESAARNPRLVPTRAE
jgi:MFS family permease